MRKPRKSIPVECENQIISDYLNGRSSVELARQFDVTPPTIACLLKKRNIPLRTRSEINHLRAPIDEERLIALVEEADLSQREIAESLGVSQATIERTLRRLGVKSKRGRGSPLHKNYFWKGGRHIDMDGYILVKSPGHPYADKRGYVREHRLVMEKSLGRHLLPSEAVHHIDGDHQNNHPDNLLVFDSNGEHLRHELMGKTPNYSPEGLQRMRENAQRVNRLRGSANRKESKTDVAE